MDTGRTGWWRRWPMASVAAGVTGALVACGTAAADGGAEADAGVRSAYLAYWTAWLHAEQAADPGDPGLARHAGGQLLTELRQSLTADRAAGEAVDGAVTHQIRGMTISGERATVVDCLSFTRWVVYDTETGKPVPGASTGRPNELAVYQMAASGGTWLATDDEVSGSC